jgi:hypothetical protein
MAKLHVVLDIDDTLQKFVRGADTIAAVRAQGIKVDEVMNKDGTSKNIGFALRPNLKTFMDYLKDNHIVSLWTWSDAGYARDFATSITENNLKRFKEIMSEEHANEAAAIDEDFPGKNLNYLWDKGTGYTPGNTVLIDDAEYNVHEVNMANMIKIRPFGGHTESKANRGIIPVLDKNDTELLTVIKFLKEISKNVGNTPLIKESLRKDGLCTTEYIPPVIGARRRTRKAKRTAYSTLRKTLAGARRGK